MTKRQSQVSEPVPVRYGSRIIAYITPEGVMRKVVQNRHMLRVPEGWAIQASALDIAVAHGVHTVEVINSQARKTYCASLVDVLAEGHRIERGHGPQIVLPLDKWTVTA